MTETVTIDLKLPLEQLFVATDEQSINDAIGIGFVNSVKRTMDETFFDLTVIVSKNAKDDLDNDNGSGFLLQSDFSPGFFNPFRRASLPGEFPVFQRGRLFDSIFSRFDGDGIVLGSDSPYALNLIESGRPFLQMSMEKMFPEILTIIIKRLEEINFQEESFG